jgi:hypothetical protein
LVEQHAYPATSAYLISSSTEAAAKRGPCCRSSSSRKGYSRKASPVRVSGDNFQHSSYGNPHAADARLAAALAGFGGDAVQCAVLAHTNPVWPVCPRLQGVGKRRRTLCPGAVNGPARCPKGDRTSAPWRRPLGCGGSPLFEPRSSPSFIPLLLRPVLPGGLQARSKHLAAAPCATTTSGSSGGSSASCYTCAAVRSPAGEWFFRPPPKPQIGAATDVLDADAVAAAGAVRLLIDGPVF